MMASRVERTLQSELMARLESSPDGRALTFIDSRGRFEWRSFRELHQSVAQCASVLSDRGLGRGDACVLVVPSDEDACHALLACLILGARPVLVAPPIVRGVHSNLRNVVEFVARKTSARMLIVKEDAVDVGRELRSRNADLQVVFSPQDWSDGDPDAVQVVLPAAQDIAAFQLTSGTTGFPKICVWKQQGVLASLDGMKAIMQLSSDDVCLNWTPLYHDMGLVNNFLLCMIHGIPLVMIETMEFLKRPSLWLRGLSLTSATVTWSPNFGFALAAQRIKDKELEGVRLDGVKSFWNAAERIHFETFVEFHRRFESIGVSWPALKSNFGCAENVGGATFSDPDDSIVVERVDSRRLYTEGLAETVAENVGRNVLQVVSVGRPFPGMIIKIVSSDGHELDDGRVGEMELHTPSRMQGYLDDATETERVIKGDGLRTGDLGYKRGEELFWVGRVGERINLHGKKFDPSDFEQALLHIDGLRKGCFAAFGVDDGQIGTQRLVIVSEVSDGSDLTDEDIVRGIKEEVAQRVGISVDAVVLLKKGTMSKTSSGKRRHQFYRQQYAENKLQSLPDARTFVF